MNHQLNDLHTYRIGNMTANTVFTWWHCNEAHCSNHLKYCFWVSSTHYPLTSKDAVKWVIAINTGIFTLQEPPPSVWEAMRRRKSFDITSKKRKNREDSESGKAMGISGNLAPIINIYSDMGGSQRKRQLKWHPHKESLSGSSLDSRSLGNQVR